MLDRVITANPSITPAHWMDFYRNALNNIQPGLNEMIVHLGYDNAELEAITQNHPAWGAAWRQRDFKAVTSQEFKQLIRKNHIILVHWKDLAKAVTHGER